MTADSSSRRQSPLAQSATPPPTSGDSSSAKAEMATEAQQQITHVAPQQLPPSTSAYLVHGAPGRLNLGFIRINAYLEFTWINFYLQFTWINTHLQLTYFHFRYSAQRPVFVSIVRTQSHDPSAATAKTVASLPTSLHSSRRIRTTGSAIRTIDDTATESRITETQWVHSE